MSSFGLPLRRGVGVAALCASFVSAMPLDAAESQEVALETPARGAVEELRRLDGIPNKPGILARVPGASIHIGIDGLVDEPEWEGIEPFDNMLVAIPATGKHGEHDTELRLAPTRTRLCSGAGAPTT